MTDIKKVCVLPTSTPSAVMTNEVYVRLIACFWGPNPILCSVSKLFKHVLLGEGHDKKAFLLVRREWLNIEWCLRHCPKVIETPTRRMLVVASKAGDVAFLRSYLRHKRERGAMGHGFVITHVYWALSIAMKHSHTEYVREIIAFYSGEAVALDDQQERERWTTVANLQRYVANICSAYSWGRYYAQLA